MSEPLPIGWASAGLYDVCDVLDGKRVPVNEKERAERLADAKSRFPYYGATGQVGEIDDFIFEGQSILLGEDGAPFLDPKKTKAYLVDGKYWVNNHAHILRAKEPISSGLLCHQLNTIDYRAYVSGTTRLKLTQAAMRDLRLVVPPANEQRRIVSKIDELFSRIDEGEQALKRVEKLVERYRQSVLKAAVTGELTRDWREARKRAGESVESGSALLARILKARRAAWEAAELAKLKAKGKPPTDDHWKQKYKEPEPPNTTDLPELPEGWVWATLPQLGDFGRGKSKHRPRNDPKLYGGQYPFLQTGTVRSSRGRITSFDSTYNEQGLAQSRLWPRGTVCITIAANIAESGILDFDACFPDSIVGVVPSDGVVGEYVEFFVRTARDDLERYAPATAQKNINLEILEQVAIPLPPYAEQQRVLAIAQEAMSKIDAVEHALGTESSRSAALRQSILKAAFSGQLVPQDPHDEPASKLLERIATERTNAVPTARKRKKKSA